MTRRGRDVLYRDIREALRFSQRAFNERRYDDARNWAYTAEAKANTLRLAAERAAHDENEACRLHPGLLCDLHDAWCRFLHSEGPCDCGLPRRLEEHEEAEADAAASTG